MQAGARVEVAAEKRHPADFALWKRAEPGHIMQWPSPWGQGFPGWHLECSAMSMKYLGETFDIHGGGLENSFPHHEDEIAQAEAATGKPFAKYWLHNNMVTVGGQKMGKCLGNFITLKEAIGTRGSRESGTRWSCALHFAEPLPEPAGLFGRGAGGDRRRLQENQGDISHSFQENVHGAQWNSFR